MLTVAKHDSICGKPWNPVEINVYHSILMLMWVSTCPSSISQTNHKSSTTPFLTLNRSRHTFKANILKNNIAYIILVGQVSSPLQIQLKVCNIEVLFLTQ